MCCHQILFFYIFDYLLSSICAKKCVFHRTFKRSQNWLFSYKLEPSWVYLIELSRFILCTKRVKSDTDNWFVERSSSLRAKIVCILQFDQRGLREGSSYFSPRNINYDFLSMVIIAIIIKTDRFFCCPLKTWNTLLGYSFICSFLSLRVDVIIKSVSPFIMNDWLFIHVPHAFVKFLFSLYNIMLSMMSFYNSFKIHSQIIFILFFITLRDRTAFFKKPPGI